VPKETNGDNQKTLLLVTVKFSYRRKYTVKLKEKNSLSRPILNKRRPGISATFEAQKNLISAAALIRVNTVS